MLSSDIASIFAGRYIRVHIHSLSYSEYLQFNSLDSSDKSLQSYLYWGGLPFLSNISEDDTRSRIDYLGSIYDTIYYQVAYHISNEETYEREFGNLKRIKDNYPKYVITMDPLLSIINDGGVKVIQASDFLLGKN